jgi:hypothetical protein
MGCRILGITDENFLQNLEQQLIKHILEKKNNNLLYKIYVNECLSYKVNYKRYSNK